MVGPILDDLRDQGGHPAPQGGQQRRQHIGSHGRDDAHPQGGAETVTVGRGQEPIGRLEGGNRLGQQSASGGGDQDAAGTAFDQL